MQVSNIFFQSLQLKNDDDVYTMLMCSEQYLCVSPIELLCIINRTSDAILFNPLSLMLTMQLCITTGSGTYHARVSFWVTPSQEQIQ